MASIRMCAFVSCKLSSDAIALNWKHQNKFFLNATGATMEYNKAHLRNMIVPTDYICSVTLLEALFCHNFTSLFLE